ncbi:MAG: amino acid ABC transporter permease, partial [Oscillospiraceae bacterium]|nr:amino acid ABC transporter permease [Oscillospiraceae bacterium]
LDKYYMYFIRGVLLTILVALFAVIFGAILGFLLTLMKTSKIGLLKFIGSAYTEFIRGTPVLVQLYMGYYGPALLGLHFDLIVISVAILSFNSAAYVSEIIRAGIESIDKGQIEASYSLGMSKFLTLREIIVPQALRNIFPALGNEFVVIIKESAVVSIIGLHDLMFNTGTVKGISYSPFLPYVIASIFYFIVTFPLSKVLRKVEKGMNRYRGESL